MYPEKVLKPKINLRFSVSFLIGGFIKEIELLLSKKWTAQLFQRVIGFTQFDKKIYTPALNYIQENYGEVYRLAQENTLYDLSKVKEDEKALRIFVEAVYRTMGVVYNKTKEPEHIAELERVVPESGVPTILISNHPYGLVETLIIARALLQRRPDVKFLANSMLSRLAPHTEDLVFSIEVVDSDKSQSSAIIDQSIDYVKEGGVIAIFPDPTVPVKAHFYDRKAPRQEMDFRTGVSRIALAADAKIVMAHVSGGRQNSFKFHLGAKVHTLVKLINLIPEFTRTQGVESYKLKLSEGPSTKDLREETKGFNRINENTPMERRRAFLKSMTLRLRQIYMETFNLTEHQSV